MESKVCGKCGEKKVLKDFYEKYRSKDGLRRECKQCFNSLGKEYRSANLEKIKERKKMYREANAEKIRKREKETLKKQKKETLKKQRVIEQQRAYRKTDAEKKRVKEYRITHRDRIVENQRKYYKANREKINKLNRENKTRCVSVNTKLHRYLGERIRRALRMQAHEKISKTTELIGCTFHELMCHLEKTVTEPIDWMTYGKKHHIDHIIPCAKFDLRDPEQQKLCFNYRNLRLLKKVDNLRKGSAILPELIEQYGLKEFWKEATNGHKS
jgi:hypothetical protein